MFGGDEEDRTPDLRIANATLSQLSYVPIFSLRFQFIPPLLTNTPPYCCRDEEVVRSSHCLCDPRIPKRMRFGTANKLGLVGVLRERCSLVELPTFALRTRLS